MRCLNNSDVRTWPWCFRFGPIAVLRSGRFYIRVMGVKYGATSTERGIRPLLQRRHCRSHVLLVCAGVLFNEAGRRTCAATKTTRVAKEAMAGTGGAGDGRDGQHRGMLDESPEDLPSEGRGVKATGGALARRRGVLVSAGYARPPTMQTTTGGAESSPVTDMLAGLAE